MSNPVPGASGGPDPTAENALPRARGGKSTGRDPSPEQALDRYAHPEAELSGADAIQKTTYVVGEGTEPASRPRGDYAARDASGGVHVGAWIVAGIAALIAVVYAIGILR